MLSFTEEELNKAFEASSSHIQQVLNSDWLVDDLEILGGGLKLTVGQIGELTKLVAYVLLNLVPLAKFIDHLENELDVSNDRATEIAERADQEIFSKIRNNITGVEAQKKAVKEEQAVIDNSESLRDSLLKEIEEQAAEPVGAGLEVKSPTMDKLKEVVSQDLEEREVDPYRELID